MSTSRPPPRAPCARTRTRKRAASAEGGAAREAASPPNPPAPCCLSGWARRQKHATAIGITDGPGGDPMRLSGSVPEPEPEAKPSQSHRVIKQGYLSKRSGGGKKLSVGRMSKKWDRRHVDAPARPPRPPHIRFNRKCCPALAHCAAWPPLAALLVAVSQRVPMSASCRACP